MSAAQAIPFRVRPLPRPGRPSVERRRRRAAGSADALALALDRARRRGGLDVLMVADRDGLVFAHSSTRLDLSMLAAVIPLVSRRCVRVRVRRRGNPKGLTVRALNVRDEILYVAGLGGSSQSRAREVTLGSAAVRRILTH